MPGQLQRLLNLVRDPMEVFAEAMRANPQRVARSSADSARRMSQDFAEHVANTAPEVEHFTYRPLRRMPSERYPYSPRAESVTQGDESAVRPRDEFWQWAQAGQPNFSIHNHPNAISLPSGPGNSMSGGGGDLAFLAHQPLDSILGVISRPRRLDGSYYGATAVTNRGMPSPDSLKFEYWNAGIPLRTHDLRDALSMPIDMDPQSRAYRSTMRDLKTLDLIDKGRMSYHTSEMPDSVLPLVPHGGVSNVSASPEELRDVIKWHQGVLEQLRKSGFALPAAVSAPSVIDQLRSNEGE